MNAYLGQEMTIPLFPPRFAVIFIFVSADSELDAIGGDGGGDGGAFGGGGRLEVRLQVGQPDDAAHGEAVLPLHGHHCRLSHLSSEDRAGKSLSATLVTCEEGEG